MVDAHGCDPRRPAVARRSSTGCSGRSSRSWACTPRAKRSGASSRAQGGITGLLLLTESHLACHTFPERGFAAFNLYCCRPREDWPWPERLRAVARRPAGVGAAPGARRAVSGYQASCPCLRRHHRVRPRRLAACASASTAGSRWRARARTSTSYGKVADLIPTPSVLALGMDGDYAGAPPFRLVGRLQLDWGQGTLGRMDARVRGRIVGLALGGAGPVPLHGPGAAAAGARPSTTSRWARRSTSGRPGMFVVAEVRSARFATAQGELPFADGARQRAALRRPLRPGRSVRHSRLRDGERGGSRSTSAAR